MFYRQFKMCENTETDWVDWQTIHMLIIHSQKNDKHTQNSKKFVNQQWVSITTLRTVS